MGDGFGFVLLCAVLFFDDFELTVFRVAPDFACACFLSVAFLELDLLFALDVLAVALPEVAAVFVPATLVLLLFAGAIFCPESGFVVLTGVDGVGLASVRLFASASSRLGCAWLAPDAISRTTWRS